MKKIFLTLILCASAFAQNNQTRIKDLTAATTSQLTNGSFVIDGSNGTKSVTYSTLSAAMAISAGGAPTKLDTNQGTAYGLTLVAPTTNSSLTANRVMILDSASRQTNSTVTDTELGYLSGVTSAVQTQFGNKVDSNNGTATGLTIAGGNVSAALTNDFATVASLKFYGAIVDDGNSDDAALTNALVAADVAVGRKGTYRFNTNYTVVATKKLRLENGGKIQPNSGVTITIDGELEAGDVQCIDESLGGRVIFSVNSRQKIINSLWWGADPSGNTDATAALRKWAYCGAAGLQAKRYLAPSAGYLVTGEIVLSNRLDVVGAGSAGSGGSTILCRPGANEAVFVLAPGANSVRIHNIYFSASASAGTNTSAIRLGDSSNNHTWIYDNAFDGFRGFAIYSAGNSLYTWISQNRFLNCRNTVASGGNGLRPSGAIFSTNVFSATTLFKNSVTTCDMAYLFDGTSITNSGNIYIMSDNIEGNGNIGALGTNVIAGNGISELTLVDVHMERNTNHTLVSLVKSKMITSRDGLYSGDYNSVVMTTNGFYFDQVEVMTLASRLSHFQSNFVLNTSSTIPVRLMGSRFDIGGLAITDSEAAAYIVGAYEMNSRLLTLSAGTVSVNDDAYDATAWNGSTNVPTKNAVYDKIESLSSGTSVLINGASIINPNFTNSATAILDVASSTNVLIYPTNIANSQLSASAAIERSKIASGTASHVVINDGSGNLSSEATLAKSRGGFAADNSSGFSVSGTNGALTGAFTVDSVTPTNGITLLGSGSLSIDGSAGGVRISPGSNVTTNDGAMRVVGNLQTASTLQDSAGSKGTSGQVPVSAGSGSPWAWGNGDGYTLQMGFGSSNPSANSTSYAGTTAVALGSNQGRYTAIIPKAGTLRGWTFSLFASGGGTSSQNVTTSIRLNNTTDLGSDSFDWISFPIRRSGQANTLSTAVVVGDYLEIKVVTPNPWTTPATGCVGIVNLYFSTP